MKIINRPTVVGKTDMLDSNRPPNFTNCQTNIDRQRLMTEVLVPELEALTRPSERAAYLNEAVL
ncbi:hypothetical protein BDV19DRAFT_362297, partial [Aspergillus venezuelensis]